MMFIIEILKSIGLDIQNKVSFEDLLGLSGNNGADLLYLLRVLHVLTILLTILLIYWLIISQINIEKISQLFSKILPPKILGIIVKWTLKLQKTLIIWIALILIILLISEYLSYHYFNFFVDNLDDIVKLYFTKK